MAAQFEDVKLPETHQAASLIAVTPGLYRCRVVQQVAPETCDPALRNNDADFLIELVATKIISEDGVETSEIPWQNNL